MYRFCHVFYQRSPLDLPLIANAFTNGCRQEIAITMLRILKDKKAYPSVF
jgi:hypothetical protein